ncbi:phosphatidylglycerophosphatase A family protein [Sporosalibacterium faouarense]|uniref:phosphatidylglycerophosphatase A family protein n=1 Tax=Sporosalibacterium faouarense TaxID=516123 RepID=UPI00141C2CDA|nr:phosphatidylglycerophosphatase A [Sporosalibacterium faouarense]MTI49347.1 phosphatidylglycerophosphatase A [Bacillota bacterium]
MKDIVVKKLKERGASIEEMAELVFELQKDYLDITMDEAIQNVKGVLDKREVQNAILTGLELDRLAEEGLIEEPLLSIIQNDKSLYGIDEVLALSITNVYGSIGFTNFGYLDKIKIGIIGKVDKLGKTTDQVHTFLDDLISGIVAAACARIAHSHGDN